MPISTLLVNSGDWIPTATDAEWPSVARAGCGHMLSPTSKRRGSPAFKLTVIRYVCEPCQFETFRTVKDD
jgi:hypothetical protein